MANWGSVGGFGDSAKAPREARVRSDTKRDVRRQKRAGEAWEGHDLELTPCVACQVPNERGEMYTGAQGLVCEGCVGGDEGPIQAPRSPSLLVPGSAARRLCLRAVLVLPVSICQICADLHALSAGLFGDTAAGLGGDDTVPTGAPVGHVRRGVGLAHLGRMGLAHGGLDPHVALVCRLPVARVTVPCK